MSGVLVHGDQVSCSRVGGAMRRESARLHRQAQALAGALTDLRSREGTDSGVSLSALAVTPDGADTAAIASSLQGLRATADSLDAAGSALQRYATELAEGHELGRRAERRVAGAGLLLEGTRVIEPWGLANARQAELRRAQMPEVQSRVDLVTAHVGRARGRLEREMTRLSRGLQSPSQEAHPGRQEPLPPRAI